MNSTPPATSGAEQPPPDGSVGAPEVAAEGVVAALRPKPHPGAVPHPDGAPSLVGGLHIVAPPSYSTAPRARSWCACGRDHTATGRAAVLRLALDHAQHRDTCPHHHPTERSNAA